MDIIKPITFKKTNGVYQNEQLAFIFNLIENKKHQFDYLNIVLRQEDKDSNTNIVSPTKFYENFIKLGIEPKVPENANENQILSFYASLFSKYDGLTYNPKTFLYNKNFSNFETEVVLLSSLINKSNTYKDFDKPYASIEFYVNNQNEETIKNYYISEIKDNNERLKYLKRFVTDKEDLNIQYKKTNFVKSYKGNITDIYRSFVEPQGINTPADDKGIYEINIPNGTSEGFIGLSGQKTLPSLLVSANTITDLLTYKKTCNYDIVGYVITKSKNNKVIKRTYVLNDKTHKGYLKYFDSQIIENAQYSYKIEQINNIYGISYFINNDTNKYPSFFKNGNSPKQKDAFIQKPNEPSLQEVLDPMNEFNYSNKEEEITLPFFKNSAFSVDTLFSSDLKQMVAYSPITNQQPIDSPDIQLSTEILNTPPSTPDIKIYSKKGESKNVLIVLSNLISKKIEATGIENKVNVIDLGASIKQQQFATKEFRVFRTEDKPISYESFSKTPRKILDPNFPDFVDPIEPNTIYYYYADAVDTKDTKSLPSKVLKLQMVEEQSHIFPLLEVYDFGEDKELITEKIFKKNIRISPTFLQSAVGPKGAVGEYIKQDYKEGFTNKLFDTSKNILDTTLNPTHKIRVTSKKTRRRFDINTIFSYEYVKDFKTIPDDAILVLEEEKKIGGLDSQCIKSSDCGSGLFCKDAPPAGLTGIIKFGKCSSVEEIKGVSEDLFGKPVKCDIGETLDSFLAGLSGAGGASFLIAVIIGGLFTKAAEKVKTKQQCDNIAPLILEVLEDEEFKDVPQESKDAVAKSLQGKVIKGKFTS